MHISIVYTVYCIGTRTTKYTRGTKYTHMWCIHCVVCTGTRITVYTRGAKCTTLMLYCVLYRYYKYEVY